MMRFIQIGFAILVVFFLMVILAQNIETLQQTLTLGYDLWLIPAWTTPPLKLYFFLLFFFVLGAFTVFFLLLFETLRFKAQAAKFRKLAAKLEAEVNSLRALNEDEDEEGLDSTTEEKPAT